LASAIEFIEALGLDRIAEHEQDLLDYATQAVGSIPGVQLVGTARHKAGVLSFVLKDIHPHDIGTILDREGIAVRTGHHCAQPAVERLGVPATARASLAVYNTREEIDALVAGLHRVVEVLG
jgi:cysteine desulfurase/selenocysteine lyase